MKRIIMHWTAGSNTPSNLDKGHYHFLIDGAGNVHKGTHPVEANRNPVKGRYAAHTLNCNTGSIGVAVCAMAGAVERPFIAGSSPITPAQVKALAALLRDLCAQYKIPVTRETVLSHAEVQPTLGIKQRGKWDIAWLPGMKAPGDPVAVGDKIRAMVAGAKAPAKVAPTAPPVPDGIKQLGFSDVRSFQSACGLEVDGISGPKTRAALHEALLGLKTKGAPQREISTVHKRTDQEPIKKLGYGAGVAVGALAAAGGWAAAKWAEVTQAWSDFWVYVFSFIS